MEQTNLFKDIKAWLSKGRAAAFAKFQPIWKSSKYSLRTKINLYSNVGEIKQRRMRCLGHVLRMAPNRIPKVSLHWTVPS
jgi:hypothetical protein